MTAQKKTRIALIGASGYTGKLITEEAAAHNIELVLMGRNPAKLKPLSDRFGFDFQTIALTGGPALQEAIRGYQLVINAAGPFSATAKPVVEACLASGVHYIDITGEIPAFETLYSFNQAAIEQGIMLMPGVGFAVVASDCLAARVAKRLPDANSLNIGVSRSDIFSRGSARTMLELFDNGVMIRRDGNLEKIPIASLEHHFDFGMGSRAALAVSWPDVFTAFHTTGINNIATFFEVGPMERATALYGRYAGWSLQLPFVRQTMELQTSLLPEGPCQQSRNIRSRIVVAEAINATGQQVRSRLVTPEAYSFSAMSTLAVAKRVCGGEHLAGFQTPAQVYGEELLSIIPGTQITDLS